jgi:hypothetical protein
MNLILIHYDLYFLCIKYNSYILKKWLFYKVHILLRNILVSY